MTVPSLMFKKLQARSSKFQRSSKAQAPNSHAASGYWCLGIGSFLEPVWCLRNNYPFAAMDFGRRPGASDEHIPKWICEERATTPPERQAALRVALKLA